MADDFTTEPMPIPSGLIIGAFRYTLGRASYAVGETVDWLVLNWDRLPVHARRVIAKDLEEAFESDDRDRAGEDRSLFKRLGMDMDRKNWERVRACYKARTEGQEQS